MFIFRILFKSIKLVFKLTFGLIFGLTSSIGSFVAFLVIGGVMLYIFSFVGTNPISIIRLNDVLSFESQAFLGGDISSRNLHEPYLLFFTKIDCGECKQIDQLEKIRKEFNIRVFVVVHEDEIDLYSDYAYKYDEKIDNILFDSTLFKKAFAFILPHTALVNEENTIIFDIIGNITKTEYSSLYKKVDALGIQKNILL